MSQHTQLLRGLFALPVLLVLAVASVTAPPQPPGARVRTTAQAHAVVIVESGQVTIETQAVDE
jgi:hypothetical protein